MLLLTTPNQHMGTNVPGGTADDNMSHVHPLSTCTRHARVLSPILETVSGPVTLDAPAQLTQKSCKLGSSDLGMAACRS